LPLELLAAINDPSGENCALLWNSLLPSSNVFTCVGPDKSQRMISSPVVTASCSSGETATPRIWQPDALLASISPVSTSQNFVVQSSLTEIARRPPA